MFSLSASAIEKSTNKLYLIKAWTILSVDSKVVQPVLEQIVILVCRSQTTIAVRCLTVY